MNEIIKESSQEAFEAKKTEAINDAKTVANFLKNTWEPDKKKGWAKKEETIASDQEANADDIKNLQYTVFKARFLTGKTDEEIKNYAFTTTFDDFTKDKKDNFKPETRKNIEEKLKINFTWKTPETTIQIANKEERMENDRK